MPGSLELLSLSWMDSQGVHKGSVPPISLQLYVQKELPFSGEARSRSFSISTMVKWASEEGFSHSSTCEVLFQISVECVPPSKAVAWKFEVSFSQLDGFTERTQVTWIVCLHKRSQLVNECPVPPVIPPIFFVEKENFLFLPSPIRGLYPPKSCASEEGLCLRRGL